MALKALPGMVSAHIVRGKPEVLPDTIPKQINKTQQNKWGMCVCFKDLDITPEFVKYMEEITGRTLHMSSEVSAMSFTGKENKKHIMGSHQTKECRKK